MDRSRRVAFGYAPLGIAIVLHQWVGPYPDVALLAITLHWLPPRNLDDSTVTDALDKRLTKKPCRRLKASDLLAWRDGGAPPRLRP